MQVIITKEVTTITSVVHANVPTISYGVCTQYFIKPTIYSA